MCSSRFRSIRRSVVRVIFSACLVIGLLWALSQDALSLQTQKPPAAQPSNRPPQAKDKKDVAAPADPSYVPSRAGAKKAGDAALAAAVGELLDKGWSGKVADRKAAEEFYRSAKKTHGDDPRFDYALGLVLLKGQQSAEALKLFDAAGRGASPPYVPAFRASIWLRVLRRDADSAVLDIVKFTKAWQELKTLPAAVQDDYVAWAGGIFGYLDGPGYNRSVERLSKEADEEIRGLITAEQLRVYLAAKNDVLEAYAARADAQEKTRVQAKKQQEQDADATKKRVADEQAQVAEKKEQVQKNAEELETALREELAVLDNQIAGLEREYGQLESRARTITRQVDSLESEVAGLLTQRASILADTENRNSNAATLNTIQRLIDQKNREQQTLRAEYDRLDARARDVQRQGSAVVAKRQAAVRQYQSESGKLFQEGKSISAKEGFLKRELQKVAKPASGNTSQVRALGQAATALRTYVDLNLEAEKQHVLDSFARPE
jgi:DNA repair exonuclease SbcCD ATPase subunit